MNYKINLKKRYGSHYYEVTDGDTVLGTFPSSTTILKKHKDSFPLMCWAAKMAAEYIANALETKDIEELKNNPEKLQKIYFEAKKYHDTYKLKRAEEGSAGHEIIEHLNLGKKSKDLLASEEYNDHQKNYLKQYLLFAKKYKVKPIKECAEIQVFTLNSGGAAGTLDSLAFVDGKLTLVDYKTSKDIYPEYWIQVASYCKMFEECKHGLSIPQEIKDTPIEQVGILRIGQEDYDFQLKDLTYVEIANDRFLCYVRDYYLEKMLKEMDES